MFRRPAPRRIEDLNNALDNIFNHPNVGPFVGKQLIQHLVKSNPSPAYISRVAAAFNNNGQGVRGDMQATISAVLLDPEARANDSGGNDQSTDGHLQEPALFIAGMVRAFGGQMNDQNYFPWDLVNLGQDIFDASSVFNYYSPTYGVPTTPLLGGEFEIHTPNAAIWRANVVRTLFSQWSNPVQSYGPGTTVDLTAFVPLAPTPATLVNALDLTLTHGTMPAGMRDHDRERGHRRHGRGFAESGRRLLPDSDIQLLQRLALKRVQIQTKRRCLLCSFVPDVSFSRTRFARRRC